MYSHPEYINKTALKVISTAQPNFNLCDWLRLQKIEKRGGIYSVHRLRNHLIVGCFPITRPARPTLFSFPIDRQTRLAIDLDHLIIHASFKASTADTLFFGSTSKSWFTKAIPSLLTPLARKSSVGSGAPLT